MNDCLLTARRSPSIALIDSKQHWGTWTKIKWHKLADKAIVTARHSDLCEPSLLDVAVADYRRVSLCHDRVRVQTSVIQNIRQIPHISNVVNQNLRGS